LDRPFRFKRFALAQDRCAMKVGSDGILLGAWAPIQGLGRALDIGTGTGLLALMLAQRAPTAQLDAIEVDARAAQQAAQNVAASSFADRITVHPTALQAFVPLFSYDLLVCNPPFFAAGPTSPEQWRQQARHEGQLRWTDLWHFARQHLAPRGQLCLILPRAREAELLTQAAQVGLFPETVCRVQPHEDKPAHRSLISLGFAPRERQLDFLAICEQGTYSPAYRALTRDFHPMF